MDWCKTWRKICESLSHNFRVLTWSGEKFVNRAISSSISTMTAMLKAGNENGIEGKNYCKIRNVLFTCCEYVRPVSFRSQSVATLNDLPCLAHHHETNTWRRKNQSFALPLTIEIMNDTAEKEKAIVDKTSDLSWWNLLMRPKEWRDWNFFLHSKWLNNPSISVVTFQMNAIEQEHLFCYCGLWLSCTRRVFCLNLNFANRSK